MLIWKNLTICGKNTQLHKIGTIFFQISTSTRRNVSLRQVSSKCPHLQNEIINKKAHSTSDSIGFKMHYFKHRVKGVYFTEFYLLGVTPWIITPWNSVFKYLLLFTVTLILSSTEKPASFSRFPHRRIKGTAIQREKNSILHYSNRTKTKRLKTRETPQ